jgi:hypothetical protein
MTCTTENNQPQFERQERLWDILKWFDKTPKTEADFYIRFQDLPEDDAVFLKSFYKITEDRQLFNMICKFWNIRISELSHQTSGIT